MMFFPQLMLFDSEKLLVDQQTSLTSFDIVRRVHGPLEFDYGSRILSFSSFPIILAYYIIRGTQKPRLQVGPKTRDPEISRSWDPGPET